MTHTHRARKKDSLVPNNVDRNIHRSVYKLTFLDLALEEIAKPQGQPFSIAIRSLQRERFGPVTTGTTASTKDRYPSQHVIACQLGVFT